jgi:hypothetical protein
VRGVSGISLVYMYAGISPVDAHEPVNHIQSMAQLSETDLKALGRRAARQIWGPRKVKRVGVVTGPDSTNQPAHYFSFQVDQDGDHQAAALLRSKLARKLRDELLAHDDPGYPYIQILTEQDWAKLERA